ncbi:MAG: class I SAM-dependent RNA methyltransferase [Chitinispirillales bacterium]|jgi:putative N6-adenine-specific DNA methylase|nr:class I SAM-dependent RNA methyltransferase [Chitinispirillales bacterium]
MFEYQKYNKFYAQAAGETEEICTKELQDLGAANVVPSFRGVSFEADKETLYRINYCSRLCVRILAPILTFDCHSVKYLTKTALNVEWDKLLKINRTFAINASVADSNITHSLYASQCLKDGIADWFNAKYKRRPNVDVENPDVRFHLRIYRNRATVSIDTSGAALHKRGYRVSSVLAPMQETLAAAMVNLANWDKKTPIWDPMCGSGTILAEILMLYCNIPAQFLRKKFGFENLPDFDDGIWEKIKAEENSKIIELPKNLIFGSDKDDDAIRVTQKNLAMLPSGQKISLRTMNFNEKESFENGVIVMNPPYGVRLGETQEAAQLYKDFGNFLKKRADGTSAFIYIGDPSLKKAFGLKPSFVKKLINGPLEGVFLKIESFRIKFR